MTPRLPSVDRVYREQFDYVWSSLRRLGVHDALLEDAAHDVFVVVHRRRAQFEGRSSVRTWLFGIARRIAFRYRRSDARTKRKRVALAAIAIPDVDLDEQLACRDAQRILFEFLGELDEGKRAAFILGEIERMERTELGAALGLNPNTAYSRLRAARARFRDRFEPAQGEHVLAQARDDRAPEAARHRVWIALGVGGVAKPLLLGAAFGGLALVGIAGMSAFDEPNQDAVARIEKTPAIPTAPARSVDIEANAQPITADPEPVEPPPSLAAASPAQPERAEPRPARPPRPLDRTSPDPTPPVDPASTLAEEAALIRAARHALQRGDPADALRVLDTHAARFPTGRLVEERAVTTVLGLCALGREAQARAQARRLAAQDSAAAYLHALRGSCAAESITPPAGGDPED